MEARLTDALRAGPDGQEAADILRSCVHCGFCTATCPTYQLLGDELDGPRGRIYLIKQVLEGDVPTASTQLHLDRCLTCRACETTCPSGVQFGRLLDIGRRVVDEQVPRPLRKRLFRSLLAAGLTGPLFAPALRMGRVVRPLLPRWLAARMLPRGAARRKVADAKTPAQGVAARGLRAAGHGTEYQRGHGACAGCSWHRSAGGTCGWLLRCHPPPPDGSGRGAAGRAPQHRCLVAVCGAPAWKPSL